jgi:hypothetical protein
MLSPKEEWEVYQKANDHECNLLFHRVTALLNSQSFLVAAASFLYANKRETLMITAVGCIGLASAALALIAIALGCSVLRRWHRRGAVLIKDYGQTDLRGCYLKNRRPMPDWIHWLTIDLYGIMLAVIFLVFWILAICKIQGVFG